MAFTRAAIFVAMTAMLTHPSSAEEPKIESIRGYERRVTENWTVVGISYPNHERNDVCLASRNWKDGSRIELIKDLKSGELRIWHQAMGWNRVGDEKSKNYPMRINFYGQKGNLIDGGTISSYLVNKNTFVIFNIVEKPFLEAFVNSNRLVFIPEGDVSNTQTYFDGKANDVATVLADCVQSSGKAPVATAADRTSRIEPPSLELPTKASAGRSL